MRLRKTVYGSTNSIAESHYLAAVVVTFFTPTAILMDSDIV